MRYLTAITVCMLLASPFWVSAEGASGKTSKSPVAHGAGKVVTPPAGESTQASQDSELAIEGKKPEDFRLRLGGTLRIKATGEYVKKIMEPGSKALTLYLDDVAMAGLPVVLEGVSAKELHLNFQLARNPEDEGNRKAWDTLLRKHDSPVRLLRVALAAGKEPAWPVQSAQPFEFSVASVAVIWVTLAVGLVIFLVAYYRLVKHKSVLRDRENGTYSLAKSQMAFWGLVVVLTFVGVWIVTGTMERIPPQALILLGISGATGLGAVVIDSNKEASKRSKTAEGIDKLKKEQGDLEKEKGRTPGSFPKEKAERLAAIEREIETLSKSLSDGVVPGISGGFWQDVCDDGNGLSFHRLQVVIWTLVLGMVFVRSVALVMSMPEFPESLLVLLGISNGTYLGFKIPEKS